MGSFLKQTPNERRNDGSTFCDTESLEARSGKRCTAREVRGIPRFECQFGREWEK